MLGGCNKPTPKSELPTPTNPPSTTKPPKTTAPSKKQLVTAKQLKDFGWKQSSEAFATRLNKALYNNGITNIHSIRMLMATMAAESDYGRYTIEQGSDAYFKGKSYGKNKRGAGYIQITHESTHKDFLKSVVCKFTGADTATYIANNYELEASVWYWSTYKKIGNLTLNKYAETLGNGSEGIFLIIQYYVNGVPSGIGSDLTSIRNGGKFEIKNNKLKVGKNEYRLPNGWDKRKKAYDKAKTVFK